MANPNLKSTRRSFLGTTAGVGAGSLVVGSSLGASGGASVPQALPELPSLVLIDHDGTGFHTSQRQGSTFAERGGRVVLTHTPAGQEVRVSSVAEPLCRVVMRWKLDFPEDTLYLGDAWERGYGDLQWRFLQPERVMPWYFAAHRTGNDTFMAGVKTQPRALCFWAVDGEGVSLWLDFRNGGSPSLPGDREIAAATIVTLHAPPPEGPMSALKRFCTLLCPAPRLPESPICGNNNWYYAYGRDFDANAMLRDAHFVADIASGERIRPYCVIDAGWTPGSVCPGGPWTAGDPKRFPDMPALAASMKGLGVRPGIWVRPTALTKVDDARRLRPGPCHVEEKPLDLTLPENLALIHDDIARIRSWGYEFIKHDFSTYDIFGRWGFEMGGDITDTGWHFADRTVTNAEIIHRLYSTLRNAAGDAILQGCNTIGHIGAGLFEVQRTGDDTSGHVWERTRRMGINTLAFRWPQHRTFFVSDPDCAAHTPQTPWELDRQYLDLVSRSGAALFISVDPRTVTAEQKSSFRKALQVALSGGAPGGSEPLDWLYTTSPTSWRFGRENVTYHWQESGGVNPLKV
jgi:alpha-galactosidase